MDQTKDSNVTILGAKNGLEKDRIRKETSI